MTLGDIQSEVMYLGMFPLIVKTNDIDCILHTVGILRKIESCDGYKRHLLHYDKNNVEAYLFAAKTSAWPIDTAMRLFT